MIGLKILRFILPPFHPFKYKYINWWFGKQFYSGAWHISEHIKFPKKLIRNK